MPQIDYSLRVGPKFDMFGLEKSSPTSPILVSDNMSSDFSLSEMYPDDTDSFLKQIKSVTTSARRTRVVANTADVNLTDVFYYEDSDEDKRYPIYLFYKVKKRKLHKPKIYINGELAKFVDNNFIYLNDTTATVEYYTQEDELILSEFQEVYPVFIWQEQINNQEIIDIDNKKYYFKLSRGNVVVSASKPNVHATIDVEPVYTLKRVKYNIVKLEPFYLETLRSNEEGRLSFEYDYMTIVPDVTKRRLEQVNLRNDDYIDLENIDIVKNSLVIYKSKDINYTATESNIDDPYRDYDIILDNSSGVHDNLIDSGRGRVETSVLIKNNLITYDDILYVSYQYVRTNNILKIEPEDIDLKNKSIHFFIKPTQIRKPGIVLDFPPELTYIISELNGDISLIKDDGLPKYEFVLPLYLGYGKGGYSENGYSGITDDFQTIVIDASGAGGGYGTGWGDLGYGEGPFGGSFLKSIDDIKNLLDIKNNSESGILSVGYINFISNIKRADIFPYRNVSEVNADMNRKTLYNYNNILWHSTYNSHDDQVIKKVSADIIETFSTIHFEPYIQFRDKIKTIVEFDLSSIHDMYQSDTKIKNEYILDSSVSAVADKSMETYDNLMPSLVSKITDIQTFTFQDGNFTETPQNILISSDFKKATVVLDTTTMNQEYDNIGLGFKNSETTVYPSLTVKL
ncbi:MAG: hypothetical protein DRQ78_00760 [Epsilonproteobacteria bacterium]|nr:MAG: hypothetical protein DRQ78_00760 [Campylobacterota bacterium]